MANVLVPGRRRPRGRLSGDRILAAALQLIDEDGIGALTMRRLAERLQADPMSLYNHFDGKEALLDGLTGTLWSEVEVTGGDWRQVLPALAIGVRRLAHAHPQAFRLVLSRATWPVAAVKSLDAALSALERAGLAREPAANMIRTLLAYAGGWAMLELSCAGATAPGTTELEQVVALTRTLPADTPAHLVETARLMACCDMDLQFSLGLQLILDGLGARLAEGQTLRSVRRPCS